MTRVTIILFTVLLTLASYFNSAAASDVDEYSMDAKRTEGEKKYSPLWFGPRIGRRKRNPSDNIFKNLDREEIDTLAGALKNQWPLMAINSEKRQMDYTPRLGRDSGEQQEAVFEFSVTSPMIPRRGRKLSTYSPRLGRENDMFY